MPVIINEFEVLAEEPPVKPAAAEAKPAGEPAPAEPADMLVLLLQLEQRALRTWAH